MTLIEVLLVLAIIGTLTALLLPAVQSARETARQSVCRNRLRELAVGIHLHESQFGHLPSGGWGWRWHSDPDRGHGPSQPGGWPYALLPFIEQTPLYQLGAGLSLEEKTKALAQAAATPVALFACPTRRPVRAWPYIHPLNFINTARPGAVARSDYAACSGDVAPEVLQGRGRGPRSLAEGDSPQFFWRDADRPGVIYRRSQVRLAQISDGTSNTYLIGEKYLARSHYRTGATHNDDQNLFVGFDSDTLRTTDPRFPPLRDAADAVSDHSFGSAHPTHFHVALVDGSVDSLSYEIDLNVHGSRGHRADGTAVVP